MRTPAVVLILICSSWACTNSGHARSHRSHDVNTRRSPVTLADNSQADLDAGVDLGSYRIERERLLKQIYLTADPHQKAELLVRLADLSRDTAAIVVERLVELENRCGATGCGVGERARKERLEHLEQMLEDDEVKLLDQVVRDHPEFALVDEALYRLGFALLDDDRPDVALRHIRTLIAKYPASPYVPHAYLAFGNHYFAQGNILKAIELYEKVLAFPSTDAAPYAHFKLGWCWFNLGEHHKSLKAFVSTVKAAERADAPGLAQLHSSAIKDLVLAYARVGDPEKAAEFFERIAADRVDELLERLAEVLFDEGKFREAILINRRLMTRVECSTVIARSQLAIYEAFMLLGDRDQMLAEAKRLAGVFIDLGECLPPEDLVGFVELGNEARQTLKAQAAQLRAEFDQTMEPEAAAMAAEIEMAAESF